MKNGRTIINSNNSLFKRILRNRELYILLIPSVLFYLIFMYKPMFGLQIAFKDYSIFRGMAESPWVGLKHFKAFLGSPYFLLTLKNTLLINIYSLIFGFPIPIILAIMLSEVKKKWFQKSVQTMSYLPHFISIVVVAGIVVNFLSPSSGILNLVIEKLNGEKTYFLIKPEYFRTIFVSMNIWKETGFNAVVYIAALASIDKQLYEAAYIDGAGKMRRIISVTIPGIMPAIIILFVLKIGQMLTIGFEAIILLYQPVTYKTADVISTYVYRMGLLNSQYDYATAVGLFNAIVSVILVVFANNLSRKLTSTSLW